MAQEGEMAVPTMWRLINLLASIEPKQHANGHRRDACAPLPRRKILQSIPLPSHSEQKNDYPAWMILISSGSAGPDFLKWFKDF
jgi:hypothetical protein